MRGCPPSSSSPRLIQRPRLLLEASKLKRTSAPARDLGAFVGAFAGLCVLLSAGSAHAGLFGGNDPIDPFTVMGRNVKKYLIEQLEGEKIVRRERGFTVQTCTSTVRQSDEGLSGGFGVDERNQTCAQSVGTELQPACQSSCLGACTETLRAYNEESVRLTGFGLDDAALGRVLRACERTCQYECSKPGKAHEFSVTSKSLF